MTFLNTRTAALLLTALVAVPAFTLAMPAAAPCGSPPAESQPGCLQWANYDIDGTPGSDATSRGVLVAMSPDGATAYVVGFASWTDSETGTFQAGLMVTATDTATGEVRWVQHYVEGATFAVQSSGSTGILVSGDGLRLFVGINGFFAGQGVASGAMALDAATGSVLWSTFADPGSQTYSMALTPDETVLYVTGFTNQGYHGMARALDAVTGEVIWSRTLDEYSWSWLYAVAAEPTTGDLVAVGASTNGWPLYPTMVRLDAATGEDVWQGINDGSLPGGVYNRLVLNPSGTLGYYNWYADNPDGRVTTQVTAVDLSTGDVAWQTSHDYTHTNNQYPYDIQVSADGGTVFVGGNGYTPGQTADAYVAAHDSATGAHQWTTTWDHKGQSDYVRHLAVSLIGDLVYAAGYSGADATAVALTAAAGELEWNTTTSDGGSHHYAMAVHPFGGATYYAGTSFASRPHAHLVALTGNGLPSAGRLAGMGGAIVDDALGTLGSDGQSVDHTTDPVDVDVALIHARPGSDGYVIGVTPAGESETAFALPTGGVLTETVSADLLYVESQHVHVEVPQDPTSLTDPASLLP